VRIAQEKVIAKGALHLDARCMLERRADRAGKARLENGV